MSSMSSGWHPRAHSISSDTPSQPSFTPTVLSPPPPITPLIPSTLSGATARPARPSQLPLSSYAVDYPTSYSASLPLRAPSAKNSNSLATTTITATAITASRLTNYPSAMATPEPEQFTFYLDDARSESPPTAKTTKSTSVGDGDKSQSFVATVVPLPPHLSPNRRISGGGLGIGGTGKEKRWSVPTNRWSIGELPKERKPWVFWAVIAAAIFITVGVGVGVGVGVTMGREKNRQAGANSRKGAAEAETETQMPGNLSTQAAAVDVASTIAAITSSLAVETTMAASDQASTSSTIVIVSSTELTTSSASTTKLSMSASDIPITSSSSSTPPLVTVTATPSVVQNPITVTVTPTTYFSSSSSTSTSTSITAHPTTFSTSRRIINPSTTAVNTATLTCPFTPSTTSISGTAKSFALTCGIDWSLASEAADYDTELMATWDDCLALCSGDDLCVGAGWGFIKGDGPQEDGWKCWLKKTITGEGHTTRGDWAFAMLMTAS